MPCSYIACPASCSVEKSPSGRSSSRYARGDAHVAAAELGHERMRGLVLPAAREVVAERADRPSRRTPAAPVSGEIARRGSRRRLRGRARIASISGTSPARSSAKSVAHRRHRHAVFGEVDQARRTDARSPDDSAASSRLSSTVFSSSGRTAAKSLAGRARSQRDRRLVVCSLKRCDERGRHARRAVVVAPRDANERRGVRSRRPASPPRARAHRAAGRSRDRSLPVVREAAQERELPAARLRAARRHVRGLVPVQTPMRRRAGRRFPAGAI
mgnify:CR=1 FL=1